MELDNIILSEVTQSQKKGGKEEGRERGSDRETEIDRERQGYRERDTQRDRETELETERDSSKKEDLLLVVHLEWLFSQKKEENNLWKLEGKRDL